jgi:hypothetical protein
LAATASASQVSFDSVAQDVIDSCVRIQQWNQLDNVIARRLKELHPKVSAPSVMVPAAIDCVKVHSVDVPRWKATNALYLGFFIALGNIAGTRSDAAAYGFKDLAGALKNTGTLKTDAQTSALAQASSDIVDAFLDARRRKSITQFAAPGGPGEKYVGQLADALKAAATIHDETLPTEKGAVDTYYQVGLQFMSSMSDVSSVDQYFHAWSADLDPIQQRHTAIAAYIRSVDNLRTGFAAITASIRDNDPAAALSVLSSYSGQLSSDISQINKAFSPTKAGGAHGTP